MLRTDDEFYNNSVDLYKNLIVNSFFPWYNNNMRQSNEIIKEYNSDNIYTPTIKEKEVISKVFNLFTETRIARDRSFEYFDNKTLIESINGSVRRWFTNIDEREDIEEWQARVFSPYTRNKVIAILGKVSSALPVADFMSVGDEDIIRAQILGELVNYTLRKDDDEELMFFAMLEALIRELLLVMRL